MYLVSLLWLAWTAHQVRAWAWGPYNDDWRKHVAPRAEPAGQMYRVVLPRAGDGTTTGAAMFYDTGNSSSSTNGTIRSTATGTGTIPLSTWSPPKYTNSTLNTTNTTTTKIDTSCGVSSPLYALQITGADGFTFNEWWLKLSGNMVLFTSQKTKATRFGVNSDTKYLCIPRSAATSSTQLPLVAIVETRLDQGPVYFLDANRTANYEPDYEPIVCGGLDEGGSLSCAWDNRANVWSGCGLQLELGSPGVGNSTQDGNLNCSSISLQAFGT